MLWVSLKRLAFRWFETWAILGYLFLPKLQVHGLKSVFQLWLNIKITCKAKQKKYPVFPSPTQSKHTPKQLLIHVFWYLSCFFKVFFVILKMHPQLKTMAVSALSYSKATTLTNKNGVKECKKIVSDF